MCAAAPNGMMCSNGEGGHMPLEEVMPVVARFMGAVDALAAIGAELSLRISGEAVDPEVMKALTAVSAAAGLPDLDSLAPPERARVLGLIRLTFRHGEDLLNDPARPPGWTFTDPVVLDGYGRASAVIPSVLGSAPEFADVTSFLDVGTGVGLLAVGAANRWPAATVVGIDVWEPSLERARTNVLEAGLDDRITLRNQDVTALDDVDAYDCVWVPTFFLPEDVLTDALKRIVSALRPGGWVVLGRTRPLPDPLAESTYALRTIRSGGATLDTEQALHLLQGAGYSSIHALAPSGPIPIEFIIGQKPASTT
jgi:SAM-dependent methyltransferase